MSTRVFVTDMSITTEDHGLEVEVTITRLTPAFYPPKLPLVSDLPADIRTALINWLIPEGDPVS